MSSSDSSTGSPKPKTRRTASPAPPPAIPLSSLDTPIPAQHSPFNVDALSATNPVPPQHQPQTPVPTHSPTHQPQPQLGQPSPDVFNLDFDLLPDLPESPQEDPNAVAAAESAAQLFDHIINVQHLMPGATLDDHTNVYVNGQSYMLTGSLGEGAFGLVCKAILTGQRNRPPHRRQEFAIKIQHVWAPVAENEFRVINLINNYNWHPNLIQTIESFVIDPNSYIVMPLAPVGDLHSQLKVPDNNGNDVWRPIRAVYCRHIIFGIASGVQYLHQIGIAHGDIKLANILVFWDQQAQGHQANTCRAFYWVPKLTDFSNSQLFDPVATFIKQGATCTITTAAPENWSQNQYDVKPVDVYSVGACMLAMLTGEYTFMPSPIRNQPNNVQQSQALKNQVEYVVECIKLAVQDQDVRIILCVLLEPEAHLRITMDQLLAMEWFARPVGSPGLEEGTLFL